jgi:hypothetical protein
VPGVRWTPGLGFFLAAALVAAAHALWTGLGEPPVLPLAIGLGLIVVLLGIAEHRRQ